MKKKLFLMCLMMAVLAIVFAISAFAEEIIFSKTESEEYGTVIQLSSNPGLENASKYVSTLNKISDAGTDKDALCILTDGNTDNPSYYVFPSSYVVDEREDGVFDLIATQLASAVAEFNSANGTTYYADYVIDGSGDSKRLNSIVAFTFPSSVVSAKAGVCCMIKYSNLVEVKINHAIDFASAAKMFYSNAKLASVYGFENIDGTNLPKTMFASCSALRYIKLPDNTTKIPGSFFQGAKGVNIVNFGELTQLTTIDAWAFDGTQNLVITLPDSVTTLNTSAFESAFKNGGSITIRPTSQLTTIGNKAFSGSNKLTGIYIPSTVTSIGESAFYSTGATTLENFENCQITTIKKSTFELATALTSIKIPETVTTIENAFIGNTKLTKVYIPSSVTSFADTFGDGSWGNVQSANTVYVYTGSDASVLSTCARLSGANVIPTSEYVDENTYTGINLVVGYSVCLAYNNGEHGTIEIGAINVDSYMQPITVKNICTVCNYNAYDRIIAPLFICDGYSTPENGRTELVIGFSVNNKAIKEYEEVSKKSIEFGAFAALQSTLGDGYIFDENGNAINNAVVAKIEGYSYGMFELKISGFKDNQKDIKLAMGAYVIATDAEATDLEKTSEYSYLQVFAPNENEKYSFVSYNDVLNGQSKEDITE